MLALLSILLLLLIPLIMLVIRVARPTFSFHWLVVILGTLVAWPLVLLSGLNLPHTVALLPWKADPLFGATPALLVDGISWPFALALATLALAIILTAIVLAQPPDWGAWAGSLTLTALGLVAVQAANPLTLILGWAALDLMELLLLLLQIYRSELRERIVAAFAARLGGILLVVWAGVEAHINGEYLTFTNIPTQVAPYLLLAAGLRLGVLPLNLPYLQELPLRRGFGVAVRLAPVAASLALLVRIAPAGIPENLLPILLLLTCLAAVYGSFSWISENDEIAARPFWILALSALALYASIHGLALPSLAWGLALILSGGMLFLASARKRFLMPVTIAGLIGLSTLPFTPTWSGAAIYYPGKQTIEMVTTPFLLLTQALLIAGYARYVFKKDQDEVVTERWIWLIYPFGLVLIPLVHFFLGWKIWSETPTHSLAEWFGGLVSLLIGILIWLAGQRIRMVLAIGGFWRRLFSMNWFYALLWQLYGWIRRLIDGITTLLEGEAGFLWALLLLAILLSVLTRGGE